MVKPDSKQCTGTGKIELYMMPMRMSTDPPTAGGKLHFWSTELLGSSFLTSLTASVRFIMGKSDVTLSTVRPWTICFLPSSRSRRTTHSLFAWTRAPPTPPMSKGPCWTSVPFSSSPGTPSFITAWLQPLSKKVFKDLVLPFAPKNINMGSPTGISTI